jgi:site-specific recombinase XerC
VDGQCRTLANEHQVTVTSYSNYLRHFKTLLNFAGEMGWKKKRTLTNESVQSDLQQMIGHNDEKVLEKSWGK